MQDCKFGKYDENINNNNLKLGMTAKLVKFNWSINITHPKVFETTFTSTQREKGFNLNSIICRNGRYRIHSANQIYPQQSTPLLQHASWFQKHMQEEKQINEGAYKKPH